MAQILQYKKTRRGQRQAIVETDFSKGMMFSEGTIPDGYVKTLVNFDFSTDGKNVLKPRAGLRTSELIFPDIITELIDIRYSSDGVFNVGLNKPLFALRMNNTVGEYIFLYDGEDWSYDSEEVELDYYGLTVSDGIPQAGDSIVVDIDPVEDFLDEDVSIKYSKECVENGVDYRQFILGKQDHRLLDDNSVIEDQGKIWVVTSRKGTSILEHNEDNKLDSDVTLATSVVFNLSSSCKFYSTNNSEIHNVKLTDDTKSAFPVGSFLRNNFYYFNDAGKLCYTHFVALGDTGEYQFSEYDILSRTASEAVQYGYNMLAKQPYTFEDKNTAATFEMEGILPYDKAFQDSDDTKPNLLMTPRANSKVWFRCNYNMLSGETYNIVWSWKEVTADEWTEFHKQEGVTDTTEIPILQASLNVPAKELMVRCEAYNTDDTTVVETAMTVGFDFTIDEHGTTANVSPENYDLSTASGMTSWHNRLVLWGLPEDPTIMFVSDLDEPGYFPYPNNITVFDEPIISVTELMDNLIVFTKSKIYQVALSDDGTSWNSTVIQSNLYINAWDKHLIQSVRNMLYFKSGNYYYMIVPKAQSTTGELTIAPITTPITDFFNHFSVNVESIFRECFKTVNEEGKIVQHIPTDMITYYNFIDYEFIHNIYVYRYKETEDSELIYIHFDIMYNTSTRYWKICIFEAPHLLYTFRNDATQKGLLASSSVMTVLHSDADAEFARFIQLFNFDDLNVVDIYLPSFSEIYYDIDHEDITHAEEYVQIGNNPTELHPHTAAGYYDDDTSTLVLDPGYVGHLSLEQGILELLGVNSYVGGFNTDSISTGLRNAIDILFNTTVFPNKQMLDTGYRDANSFINKRYRELQLQINNVDNVDIEFGMDFDIAGEPRNTDFKYEVSQAIDELESEYGIAYLEAVPYQSVPYEEIEHDENINLWTLKHSLVRDVTFWKVRASISGKGVAPRVRLYTRNQVNYQLIGFGWVYREMNMR